MTSIYHKYSNDKNALIQATTIPCVITLRDKMVEAIREQDVNELMLTCNGLVIASVDIKQYPESINGNLFTAFFSDVEMDFHKTHFPLGFISVETKPKIVIDNMHILKDPYTEALKNPVDFMVRQWDNDFKVCRATEHIIGIVHSPC